ncbi:acetyl-CoA hydrolase/transferase family protein [Bacillus sp. HMF5848]|uniref:acetyl-CoA hydrolase/transferase family protein n=1 Tax=Bacillus sp. HMF5848 TaxID=2495421 RepID=UPI000F769E6B|nr:acetyl-CoA hydrolase/transferase C-terminal domain-containing protein [Bacillus sp. HMF5848]RSK27386.1 acetyl-CoA hydrolase/transferase family protein [Bacillus sp. HMF5848]
MLLELKRKKPEDVLELIKDGADLIVPLANGEPSTILDVIEEHAMSLSNVRIHQMHPLRERKYMWGEYGNNLRHVSYFLSGAVRKAYLAGKCDLVPNHFHEVPKLMRTKTKASLIIAQASPVDEHGYFSLGTNADYTSTFIGKAPFFLEVNKQMPRTYGGNQIHVSQIEGYIEVDYPLADAKNPVITEEDKQIASQIVDRIPNGATIQMGIGAIPNAIVAFLQNHKHLGIHTELLSDGAIELIESGVVDGSQKMNLPGKIVTTFCLGSKTLYDFIDQNGGIEMMPVDYVNDPRVIAKEDCMISMNATTDVDFLGQCASETIGGKYYSSSGGQADFARGALFSKNGKGFICLHSTAKNGEISRIKPQLSVGSAVTTSKNDVDHVVTEYGVAELRGATIAERTKRLIAIAHPKFRDELTFEARKLGFL